MAPDRELAKLAKEAMELAGIPPETTALSSSTEAAQYFQAGYEAIAFGAGPIRGNSHGPNEYNRSDDLEKATLFYEKLIERVCL